jgi:spore coat protein A
LGVPGAVVPIDANEMGWKDTVRVNAKDPANPDAIGQVTRLLVRFEDDGDATRDYRGHFVFHCHLLEHEDMGMMRPLEVY